MPVDQPEDAAPAPDVDLASLLAVMTPETFPEVADFGGPVGKEEW